MPKKMKTIEKTSLRTSDVQYLAFEGGGGKGIAYIGALQALESLHILPASRKKIKGVSGSSAGAITALMVALGLNSSELASLLTKKGQQFKTFFDGPDNGKYRSVKKNYKPDVKIDEESGGVSIYKQVLRLRKAQKKFEKVVPLGVINPKALAEEALGISSPSISLSDFIIKYLAGEDFKDVINNMMSSGENWFWEYLYNLLFDRGIFSGFKAREFFTDIIEEEINKRFNKPLIFNNKRLGLINFLEFYDITRVDLVITGTNITRQQPRYFSRADTPYFPVAEAIGISMSIPFVFKPVWVDALIKREDYEGFWVDGGVLNNLPIHAFDDIDSNGLRRVRETESPLPLNKHIFALRLTEGWDPYDPKSWSEAEAAKKKSSIIGAYLASVFETLMYPSEEGQFMTKSERDQSIDLYTQKLTLLDFLPSEVKRAKPISDAEERVLRKFGQITNRPKNLA